ncbi:zinc metalloprotease HtpX [Campylobacter concisus]|uniref:Protease HtpX homolog n=1 Tax=Campylobacter concisus ATCC 51562 TaxID=1242969 RepID=U2GJG6_9BACT|nr:zinc metalloprotease HtpX [Campylobacter concisus]ERJ26108.1 Peptidase M48, Ste24p precursor [Campylobacter concisus ATCC 51562]
MEIFKTAFLMVTLMLIFIAVGGYIGGEHGMMIAFLIAAGTNIFSYFFSDTIVLKRYNAIPVDESNAHGLYEIISRLTQKANLPMPKIYIIPEEVPNAFATGRNPSHAAVAVTEGLLKILNENEIEGVLAHELSHVRHYDILTGSIAAILAGAIAMLANFVKVGGIAGQSNGSRRGGGNAIVMLALAILMPIAATIIQMAISREREYKADKGAAYLTGHPEWLASALRKLESYSNSYVMQNASEQSAHMFIVNPFGSLTNKLGVLFRTHPSTSDRIAELQRLEQEIKRSM